MLPPPAVFHFPWEILTDAVNDGASVRTFGRLTCYRPEESMATLSCQHASAQYHVPVQTVFVEPFHPIIGAHYIVLGEIERSGDSEVLVRARVLNCVDGVDIALLQRAIHEQRNFLKGQDGEADVQAHHSDNG